MPESSNREHFEIHASVVFQLGESLITDSVQALVELVKNSYDADASYCKLTINTERVGESESPFRGAAGSITVEDDGTGMTLEDIRRGWLTISNSEKRALKDRTQTTPKGRTPLGDKGLGRLGTQRLGYNLEMFTRTETSPVQHHVWFSWKDFVGQRKLSDVDIHRDEVPPTRKHGTTLIISQLRELPLWRGDGVKDLESSLSQLISPYKEVRDFVVYAVVDGKELELLEVGEKLRQSAQLRYSLDFNGELFRVSGKARLSYIRPDRNPEDRALFTELVESDGGMDFFRFLKRAKRSEEFSLDKIPDDGWFVSYTSARYLEDFDGLELLEGRLANPGPFKGEVDFFSLGVGSASEQTVFSTAAEYRQLIDKLKGIKVFRDGFGVRVASDWLDLGKQWTKGGSYYGLKPHNTLGYIAITAKDNRQLEETTDREGFKINAYYKNFFELLSYFVEFSGNVQAFLRRGWIDFRKAHEHRLANVPEDAKPESLSAAIQRAVSRAAQHRAALSSVSFRLRNTIDKSQAAFQSVEHIAGNGNVQSLKQALSDLSAAVHDAERVSKEAQEYLEEVARLEAVGSVLSTQIQTLREQIQQVHEVISLGLTAEALSHEINNIATQLAQRNQQVVRYMKSNAIRDSRISTFTEYVNTSVAGLRRQLLFLAPSLRYVREKREAIDIDIFITELVKHYTAHFAMMPIAIIPKGTRGQNFRIEMNKGRLVQIFDNLILNSEYWLLEDVRRGVIARGEITITAAKPYIRVSDNGRGVDPTVETSLFEPFVSAKGKGKGRGLGLYIVQQLLEAEGCSVRLLPARNKHDRRSIFEIDMTGALLDKR